MPFDHHIMMPLMFIIFQAHPTYGGVDTTDICPMSHLGIKDECTLWDLIQKKYYLRFLDQIIYPYRSVPDQSRSHNHGWPL